MTDVAGPRAPGGRALFEAYAGAREDAFTWLGQHSFILGLGGHVLLVDPFLAEMDARLLPPLFAPADAAGIVSLVCCTHDHIDHIDPVAVTGLSSDTAAHFIAPAACRARMLALGVPSGRLTLLDDGETASFGSLAVTAVKAAHEDFDETPDGRFPYLGYVFAAGGRRVYHAGDTVWWEGLQARLSAWRLDLALLPINGRDGPRFRADVMGNLTFQEAADLAGGLDVDLLVPTHYGMFAFNTEDPARFADYMDAKYPGRRYLLAEPGRRTAF